MMEVTARAKLNLTLDVLALREDGYHDLKMIMQSVALGDDIVLREGQNGLSVKTNLRYVPDDDRNLAVVAVGKFCAALGRELPNLDLKIFKRIPVCAGMAGGSSDAAAVLLAMNALTGAGLSGEQLQKIGAEIGSDVPYCILGTTALAQGRGEELTELPPLPHCYVAICKPPFSVSTPELFRAIRCQKIRRRPDTAGTLAALEAGDLMGVARRMYNVFEDVLSPRWAGEIAEIKNKMVLCGALGASMTGTGPTVFGLFDREDWARAATDQLKGQYRDVFLTETV